MNIFLGPVSAYLSSPVHTIAGDALAERAAEIFHGLGVSSLLVGAPDGRALGVISRTDLLRRSGALVRDRMSHPVIAARASDTIRSAAREMWTRRVHRLYVLEDGHPVGVFGTREVMLAVRDSKSVAPLADLMTAPVVTVDVASPTREATALLEERGIAGVIVVEGEFPVGLYTQVEALSARARLPGAIVEDVMSHALLCLRTTIPAHRAAAFSVSASARRVVVVHQHEMRGLVTGLDFARLAAEVPAPHAGVAAG